MLALFAMVALSCALLPGTLLAAPGSANPYAGEAPGWGAPEEGDYGYDYGVEPPRDDGRFRGGGQGAATDAPSGMPGMPGTGGDPGAWAADGGRYAPNPVGAPDPGRGDQGYGHPENPARSARSARPVQPARPAWPSPSDRPGAPATPAGPMGGPPDDLLSFSGTDLYSADPCPDLDCFVSRLPPWLARGAGEVLSRAKTKQGIIRAVNKPGTSRPWYEFKKNNVSETKVSKAMAFWDAHSAEIGRAARTYGVNPEVMLAILAIETNLGQNSGNFRVVDALNTLAFSHPKRPGYFQNELMEFLLMSRIARRDPLSYLGSYAGAMGMPQFMPSSYNRFARDGDGDGFADIWDDPADVAASVANYLKNHGWIENGRVTVKVDLVLDNRLQAVIDEKTSMRRTVGELRAMGVNVPPEVPDSAAGQLYSLEVAPGEFEYYVGLSNFYVIWHYNHSRMYVHAVNEIARRLFERSRRR